MVRAFSEMLLRTQRENAVGLWREKERGEEKLKADGIPHWLAK
jgi:hypothetical protein